MTPLDPLSRLLHRDQRAGVIRGVSIAPRDYILADERGVVAIPAVRIEEVLALAERIAEQEAVLEAQAIDDAVTSLDAVQRASCPSLPGSAAQIRLPRRRGLTQ